MEPAPRIQDISPGYLSDAVLREELDIIARLEEGDGRDGDMTTLSRHCFREQAIVNELAFRRSEPGPPRLEDDVALDPGRFTALEEQLATAAGGRIPSPRSPHELWAQHKYSVMARDPARYRELGRIVAGLRGSDSQEALARELTVFLGVRPEPGRLRNALEHMWGYVSGGAGSQPEDARGLLDTIGVHARRQPVPYLLHSTALVELKLWV